MSTRELTADLELAHRLADAAAKISMARYQAMDLVIETKPDLTPVTDADKATEEEIRKILAIERPDDLIIGEEFGAPESTAGKHYWVIDPIDGTKNFMRGVPTWATLIGLVSPEHKVVVGVVNSPALFRRWSARAGNGAHISINGGPERSIRVSTIKALKDASLSYSDLVGWGNRLPAMLHLQEQIWRTRGLGDFWSHMLVAEGVVDIAVEPALALWDMAALDVIVREAGGRFTNLDGVDGPFGGSGVSSNGSLHHAFLKALAKH